MLWRDAIGILVTSVLVWGILAYVFRTCALG
jgi:hypothetical protein